MWVYVCPKLTLFWWNWMRRLPTFHKHHWILYQVNTSLLARQTPSCARSFVFVAFAWLLLLLLLSSKKRIDGWISGLLYSLRTYTSSRHSGKCYIARSAFAIYVSTRYFVLHLNLIMCVGVLSIILPSARFSHHEFEVSLPALFARFALLCTHICNFVHTAFHSLRFCAFSFHLIQFLLVFFGSYCNFLTLISIPFFTLGFRCWQEKKSGFQLSANNPCFSSWICWRSAILRRFSHHLCGI